MIIHIIIVFQLVKDSHQFGGTMLGTSRGPQDPKLMVDFMVASKINVLFCIGTTVEKYHCALFLILYHASLKGGDGTQRGALVLANEITRRGLQISIIGIGKTIDNDLLYVDRSFGFDTAVQHAQQAIITCHEEVDLGGCALLISTCLGLQLLHMYRPVVRQMELA